MRRLLLMVPLLLSGCASVQKLAAEVFTPPRLHFVDAKVAAVDLDGTTVILDFTLENPNQLALRVARATSHLEVEKAKVADGELPGGLTLPARGTAPFAVTVRLRWSEVARFAEQVRRQTEVAYRVDGVIAVDTPIGPIDLPYKHDGRLPVPRLPSLRLAGGSVSMSSLTDLELTLVLDAENPNGFPLPGATLHFDLLVNDVTVATGREAALSPLKAGGGARVTLPVRVSLLGVGRAASSLHGGGLLRLKGAVRAAGLERPVDLTVDLGRR